MNQKNKMRTRAAILAALLLLIPATAVRAEEQLPEQPTDIEDLAPNIYEQEKIKQQTDYFHEESLYKQKYNIPEELKNLEYKAPDPNRDERQIEKLFADYSANKLEASSTAAQTAKAGLFMDSEEELFQSTGAQNLDADSKQPQSSALTILYIAIIGIGLLLILVILIPKLTSAKKEEV